MDTYCAWNLPGKVSNSNWPHAALHYWQLNLKSADKRGATRAVQCVQCKNLRWERENIGSYTWTFVLPAQPTDERKGRGWGGGKRRRRREWEGRGKKGTRGYGEKGGDRGKWRRERLLLVMCTFVQRFGEYQHTLICFNIQLPCSLHLSFFFFFLDQWCSRGTNHLPSSPGYNTSHTVCFNEQIDPEESNTAN